VSDSMPPDELNRLGIPSPVPGRTGIGNVPHYGFPFCYGHGIPDPASSTLGFKLNPSMSCDKYQGAVVEFPAHGAAMGFTFYDHPGAFPDVYQGAPFVALHGSWDASIPTGYSVAWTPFQSDNKSPLGAAEEFISFRLEPPVACKISDDCPGNSTCQDQSPAAQFDLIKYCGGRGRPTDVAMLPSGELLISDQLNSLVYKIEYTGKRPDCVTTYGKGCAAPSIGKSMEGLTTERGTCYIGFIVLLGAGAFVLLVTRLRRVPAVI